MCYGLNRTFSIFAPHTSLGGWRGPRGDLLRSANAHGRAQQPPTRDGRKRPPPRVDAKLIMTFACVKPTRRRRGTSAPWTPPRCFGCRRGRKDPRRPQPQACGLASASTRRRLHDQDSSMLLARQGARGCLRCVAHAGEEEPASYVEALDLLQIEALTPLEGDAGADAPQYFARTTGYK